jgi:hypothetical protein
MVGLEYGYGGCTPCCCSGLLISTAMVSAAANGFMGYSFYGLLSTLPSRAQPMPLSSQPCTSASPSASQQPGSRAATQSAPTATNGCGRSRTQTQTQTLSTDTDTALIISKAHLLPHVDDPRQLSAPWIN